MGWRSERSRAPACHLRWAKRKRAVRPQVRRTCSSWRRLKMSSRSALTTHAADPALGICVRVRRLDRRVDHRNPFAVEDVIAAAAELRVAIVDEEAERLLATIESHQQVACLLGNPAAARAAARDGRGSPAPRSPTRRCQGFAARRRSSGSPTRVLACEERALGGDDRAMAGPGLCVGKSSAARPAGESLRVFLCIGGWLGVVGDAVSEVDAQDCHRVRPVVTGAP